MMFLSAPLSDGGTVGILGLTTEDLVMLVAGKSAPLIPFEYIMAGGNPLPRALQVFYAPSEQEVLEKLREVFPDVDFRITERS